MERQQREDRRKGRKGKTPLGRDGKRRLIRVATGLDLGVTEGEKEGRKERRATRDARVLRSKGRGCRRVFLRNSIYIPVLPSFFLLFPLGASGYR